MTLIKPVIVLFRGSTAHAVEDHKDDGRRQNTSNDNQQKLHGIKLAPVLSDATPATDSRPRSAEMATDCPNDPGISAYVSSCRRPAMVGASEKEDAPWMNSATPRQTPLAVAGSVSLSPQLSSFWSCFTRSSRAVASARLLTQPQRVEPKKRRPRWKKQRQHNRSPQQWANKPKTTHNLTSEGGCSNAPAFAVFVRIVRTVSVRHLYALPTLQIKGVPC